MFFGVTRFSLFMPNSTAWYLSKDVLDDKKIEEYKQRLFSSERLEERIEIFFGITIPSLAKMAVGRHYCHILQISDEMPLEYKQKIVQISSDYDFITIQEVNRHGNSLLSLQDIILNKLGDQEKYFGLFNLDDDDLLAMDFFQKSASYINEYYKGHVISYGTGITGLLRKNGVVQDPRLCYQPKINIGLLKICWVEDGKIHIPRVGNHKFADKFSPVILDSREVMYFWTRHLNQDSSRSFNDRQQQLNVILTDLEKFNPIDIDQQLREKFPLLDLKTSDELTVKSKHVINEWLTDKNVLIELGGISGKISIEFEIVVKNLDGVVDVDRIALASFVFKGNPEVVPGLSRSQNPDIGLFKYLSMKTKANNSMASISLFLPPELPLQAIRLQKWKIKSDIRIISIGLNIEEI